jgi:hypothetical protein
MRNMLSGRKRLDNMCTVSFITWSWAFSIYDNWVPVDWTSIQVPPWTTLSYDDWVQWVVFAFYIWNKSYTVYERNWYSWTKKYLEWITIDWVAFTKWTYTITWDTEIDALWVRNGISITFTLSPQPTPTPPLAPTIYPSWVLVNKVTLNYNWYAAIIWFDEWEYILVPEQQWYEATWVSVSAWTALYADTTITIYLQQLVTCSLADYQTAWLPSPYALDGSIETAVRNIIQAISEMHRMEPNEFDYILMDQDGIYWFCRYDCTYRTTDQRWNPQYVNSQIYVAFYQHSSNPVVMPYECTQASQYQVMPLWTETHLPTPNYINGVFTNWDEYWLNNWMADWNCRSICDFTNLIKDLAEYNI